VSVLDERTWSRLRALLSDDNATRDALALGIYSLSGIAALIDIRGRVPTIDEYKHARHEHPAWHLPNAGLPDTGTRSLS
jgi:hypothetical protein